MSFSTIIVTGRYHSVSGPASGTVTFTRSALLRSTVTGEIALPTPIVAHLDSEGVLRVPLIANDDKTTTPTDSTYLVQEAAGDCTRTYSITVPYDTPNGILDLVTVASGLISGQVQLFAVTGGSGGGGDLTPPVTIGTPAFSFLAGDTSLYPLIVSAAVDATNNQNTTMLVGNDDPAFALDGLDAYTGTAWALYGRATGTGGQGVTGYAVGDNGIGVAAQAQGAGGRGVSASAWVADGVAVYALGAVAGATGLHAQATGGHAIEAVTSGGGYVLRAFGGGVFIGDQTEPDTPGGGGVLWVEGGALKYKGSSGTITTLAPA